MASNDNISPQEGEYATVADFVRARGGNLAIEKLLIANNGIAAVKGIRSMRRWAYQVFGNERAIKFVVMAIPEDITANAEYIRLADEVVEVPGGPNVNNYANVGLIVDIAEQTGAQAVWAGWGHASENPSLPDSLSHTRNHIVFVGPPALPMHALGDKISSSIVAESARVPTVDWSGSGITVPDDVVEVPPELYKQACVESGEAALEKARKIGYPLMIKASEGGGGKGIRKVSREEDLLSCFRQVQAELPGSPIFLMKLCPDARHLEIQLLCDFHGNAIALAGRDCSVQRRHQKIIEEGPIIAASRETVREMEQAAVRLAKRVHYASVGTVEFLYRDGKFYFLELNPRLQVEHPVTEWVTNVNLPAAQLQVAMGIPLHHIADIRRLYGEDPYGESTIDFDNRQQILPRGHVIATRITAENADTGFQPTSGAIRELSFRNMPNLWGYFSVGSVGGIHNFADSQFGHLFAWGETREIARKTMNLALSEVSIRGDIRHTVQFLKKLLDHQDYKMNNISTAWLDGLIARKVQSDKPDQFVAVICAAVHVLHTHWESNKDKYLKSLERGQHPAIELLRVTFPIEFIYDEQKFNIVGTCSGRQTFTLAMNGSYVQARIRVLRDSGLLILIDRQSHVTYAWEEPSGGLRVTIDGKTCLFTQEVDPSKLRATMPGKLVKFLVQHGTRIAAGTPFAEIEMMKMYIPLLAPLSGKIKLKAVEGTTLQAGDILAEMDLDDPSQIKVATPFVGKFPQMNTHIDDRPHKVVANATTEIRTLLSGYDYPAEIVDHKLSQIIANFRRISDPQLPLYEFRETMSIIRVLLNTDIKNRANAAVDKWLHSEQVNQPSSFPIAELQALFQNHVASLSPSDKEKWDRDTTALYDFFRRHEGGWKLCAFEILSSMFRDYLLVEKTFDQNFKSETLLLELRDKHKDNLEPVFELCLANSQQARRNKVILLLLTEIETTFGMVNEFMGTLCEISTLVGKQYGDIVLKVKQMLLRSRMPSFQKKQNDIEEIILNAVASISRTEALKVLIEQSSFSFDHLVTFFSHNLSAVLSTALEVYIRKAYCTFSVNIERVERINMQQPCEEGSQNPCGIWLAQWEFTHPQSPSRQIGFNRNEGIVGSMSTADLTVLNENEAARNGSCGPTTVNVMEESENEDYSGFGTLAIIDSLEQLQANFGKILAEFSSSSRRLTPSSSVNVLQLAVRWNEKKVPSDAALVNQLNELLLQDQHRREIKHLDIRRVTFVIIIPGQFPLYYTFRQRSGFHEDPIYRHVEPTLAFQLCLRKLINYDIQRFPTENPSVHLFYAERKKTPRLHGSGAATAASSKYDKRFFVRSLVLQGDVFNSENPDEFKISEAEQCLVECLNALEIATTDSRIKETYDNHIFINILPEIVVDPTRVSPLFARFQDSHASKLLQLRVSEVELKINIKTSPTNPVIPLRFVATNDTGYELRLDIYQEIKHINTGRTLYSSMFLEDGPLNGKDINIPHPHLSDLQLKRITARDYDTLYAYDFPFLFKLALKKVWGFYYAERSGVKADIPRPLVSSVELVLNDRQELVEVQRGPGLNNIGMIAWRMTLRTPEYPQGRDIIVIANDITFQSGSFGPKEDLLFKLASERARQLKLPRLYITANSGARIGLANEIKQLFRIAWVNDKDPTQGFKYVYLTDDDYKSLQKNVGKDGKPIVNVEAVQEPNEKQKRWRITDIIGNEDGLGVENLQGSGMIAGETSRAYDEIFTLNYVSCRTVGIGAYLVRLGQRVIQHRRHPIILTGAPALNKVLGKEVYSSNIQLGGTQIMYPNGVTHLVTDNDLRGCLYILRWLSFVPIRSGAPLPITDAVDPIEREIEFCPVKDQQYDPCHLLGGQFLPVESPDGARTSPPPESTDSAPSSAKRYGRWISGFFDKGTFWETMAGWAKGVVTGRARLGGIPVGAIAVETRTTQDIIPADPADASSQQKILQKAGQVWYPDSAYKTAQAIRDFNGEGLPLFIFANWRGFSGGMRDMFDEVLKFGSYIVDALVAYRNPVFVYIPPFAELRGGAWVVVDPSINIEVMEMFADENARGGVLEPSGTVEIKYRDRDLIETMHRTDETLQQMDRELRAASDQAQRERMQRDISERERKLIPIFRTIAEAFCDLHDTPGRMKSKEVINRVVPWKNARQFFYWRLRRRLEESSLVKRLAADCPHMHLSRHDTKHLLKEWITSDAKKPFLLSKKQMGSRIEELYHNDRAISEWIAKNQDKVDEHVRALRAAHLRGQAARLCEENDGSGLQNLLDGVSSFVRSQQDPAKKSEFIAFFKEKLKELEKTQ